MIKILNYPWESIKYIFNNEDFKLTKNSKFSSQLIGYTESNYTNPASGTIFPTKKLTNKYKLIDLPGPALKGDTTNKIELSINNKNNCDFIYNKNQLNSNYEFFFDDVMNFILFILRDKECINIKSFKGKTKYWDEILNKLSNHKNQDPAKYALIVDLSEVQELIKPLNEITGNPKKILKRIYDQERIQKVREIDKKCIIDLARRPGSRIAEKAGPKQRILAIKRFEDVNILENKVSKHCSELAINASKKYIKNHQLMNITSENSERVKSVEKLERECTRLPKNDEFISVQTLKEPCKVPNYTLLQNSNYQKIWKAYSELLKNEDLRDNLWKWYNRMWSEFTGYFLAYTLKKIELKIPIKEVGQKSVLSNKRHNNGKWLFSDLLPGPYIYNDKSKCSTIYFINGDYESLSKISDELKKLSILNADYLAVKISNEHKYVLPIYSLMPDHTFSNNQYFDYFNNIPISLIESIELFNKNYNNDWISTDPWIIAADWNNNNKTGYTTNLSSNYSKWDDSFNESLNIINKLIEL